MTKSRSGCHIKATSKLFDRVLNTPLLLMALVTPILLELCNRNTYLTTSISRE